MEAKKPTLLDVFHSFTGGKTEMESKPYTKLYKKTVESLTRSLL